jgi:hypothetical protein
LLAPPAIAAHPVRPNLYTAVVTAARPAVCFLLGGLTVLAIPVGH